MVEPLRHRQTKGVVTDMFDLKPPRHTSTLPNSAQQRSPPHDRFGPHERTWPDHLAMSQKVESRMGAVAWGRWPTPRFPSPLIEPDVPISGISPAGFIARHTATQLGAGALGAVVRVLHT